AQKSAMKMDGAAAGKFSDQHNGETKEVRPLLFLFYSFYSPLLFPPFIPPFYSPLLFPKRGASPFIPRN
ncbi:MAG: hypothetical protein AAFP90_11175, partial [Planctomycetota bacterium]